MYSKGVVMTKSWDENRNEWDTVLNSYPVPQGFTEAKPPIPVLAHLVWKKTGGETIEADATAWTRDLVLVEFPSAGKLRTTGCWIRPRDVERRQDFCAPTEITKASFGKQRDSRAAAACVENSSPMTATG